jgi:hypothetical protein
MFDVVNQVQELYFKHILLFKKEMDKNQVK